MVTYTLCEKEGPGKLTCIPDVVWISGAKFNWTNSKQTRRCEQIFHLYLYSCKQKEEIRLEELVLSPFAPLDAYGYYLQVIYTALYKVSGVKNQ